MSFMESVLEQNHSILNFVTDTESAVRLNYLRQFGMTDDDIEFIDPLPENQDYIDFLFETAERGNGCEIQWCAFADEKCRSFSEADQKKLGSIFEKAGYLELDFWNMTYRRKKA